MTRFLSRLLVAAALVSWAAPALAQNTAAVQVTANVKATCKVSSAPGITLDYDLFDTATAVKTGNISIACTNGGSVRVAADGGLPTRGPVGTFLRSVADVSSNKIGYSLSIDGGTTQLVVGGAGTAPTPGLTGQGKGTNFNVPVTISLDTAGDPAVGTYTDTVTLTFTAL